MKTLLFAAALTLGSASFAQAQMDPNGANTQPGNGANTQPDNGAMQMDPNGPNTPPGDGLTRMGTNPSGQSYTPPGFNQGMNVYPSAAMAPGTMPGMSEYPRCSRQVTDRCVQAYTKMTTRRRR